MKSDEIRNLIDKKQEEINELERQWKLALQAERDEGINNRLLRTKDEILKLWELYWADEDNTEAKERLDNVADQHRLNIWLQADTEEALIRSNMNGVDKIREIVKESIRENSIDFNTCLIAAEIRTEWATALRSVKHGSDLSHKVSWGFSTRDLIKLGELHKGNKFRKKIEDLLEDCNFHSECGLLADKNYEEYMCFVQQDD